MASCTFKQISNNSSWWLVLVKSFAIFSQQLATGIFLFSFDGKHTSLSVIFWEKTDQHWNVCLTMRSQHWTPKTHINKHPNYQGFPHSSHPNYYLIIIIPPLPRVNYTNYLNYQGFPLGCRAGLQLGQIDDSCFVHQSWTVLCSGGGVRRERREARKERGGVRRDRGEEGKEWRERWMRSSVEKEGEGREGRGSEGGWGCDYTTVQLSNTKWSCPTVLGHRQVAGMYQWWYHLTK